MTTTQHNILYRSSFDGSIFIYSAKNLLYPILWLLGFKQTMETPVNVVLGYKKRKVFSKVTLLELTINRYSFGQDTPNPVCFPPIFFMGKENQLLSRLIHAMEESILQSKYGLNVGLMNVNVDKLREYHSNQLMLNRYPNQGFLTSQPTPNNRLDIEINIANSSLANRCIHSPPPNDDPSLGLMINKEIPRDAGV